MNIEIERLFGLFKSKKIDIIELQGRISTVCCEKVSDSDIIRLIDNELERIIFCYNPDSYYSETMTLYENLINNE